MDNWQRTLRPWQVGVVKAVFGLSLLLTVTGTLMLIGGSS